MVCRQARAGSCGRRGPCCSAKPGRWPTAVPLKLAEYLQLIITCQKVSVCEWGFLSLGRPAPPLCSAATWQSRYGQSPPAPPHREAHRGVALGVLVLWVLPRLRQQPVVPVDVVGVEPQLALLPVLLDGRLGLVLRAGNGICMQGCVRACVPCAMEPARRVAVGQLAPAAARVPTAATARGTGAEAQRSLLSITVTVRSPWRPPSWRMSPWGSHKQSAACRYQRRAGCRARGTQWCRPG